jgi:hypothetical protein
VKVKKVKKVKKKPHPRFGGWGRVRQQERWLFCVVIQVGN